MSCRNTGGQASANYKEVTAGMELFAGLDGYQSSSEYLPPLTIYAQRATTPTPVLYPKHQGFMTQLPATRLKHNTKGLVFTSARFTVGALPSLSGLLSLTFNVHRG